MSEDECNDKIATNDPVERMLLDGFLLGRKIERARLHCREWRELKRLYNRGEIDTSKLQTEARKIFT